MKHLPNDGFLGAITGTDILEENLLNLFPSPTYVCDSSGMITKCNRACSLLWGTEPDAEDRWFKRGQLFDAEGIPVPERDFPGVAAMCEKKMVAGNELIVRNANGYTRRVVASANPILKKTGEVAAVIIVLADVTEVRERELRKNLDLKKSEERYHKMIDEVKDYAILLLDKDGTILNWNQGAQRIKGYTEEEIVGKNFSVFYRDIDREDGLPQMLIETARREGRAIHEGPRLRKDGTLFWGSITITALHDDKGEVIGFSKVTRDLTEKKIAEDRIKDYTEELEYQNRELEQFAYAAAHDMKEPLRKILFYTTHVRDTSLELMPEKAQSYVLRTLDAAARMQKLIDDLLSYSRATAREAAMETVSVATIITEAWANHQDTVKELGATLDMKDLPKIKGITFQLRQLFDNLVGNALKYNNPERKTVINVSAKESKGVKGEPGFDRHAKFTVITVADNGIGFDPSYAQEMFNLFTRLHPDSNQKGTGIGLALCKRIMQNHKGFIEAKGEVGEGTTINLYFPAESQPLTS